MNKKTTDALTVYYNSACPVCNSGINAQKNKTTGCTVTWNDIHSSESCAFEVNQNIDTIRKYLHVVDETGKKHVGIAAFIQLWKYSPREQWKAKLISLPIINLSSKIMYFVFANLLFWWNNLAKIWRN